MPSIHQERIRQALKQGPLTIKQIELRTGTCDETVRRAMLSLQARGEVTRKRNYNKPFMPYEYSLSELPTPAALPKRSASGVRVGDLVPAE